jgi:hypothetical protein
VDPVLVRKILKEFDPEGFGILGIRSAVDGFLQDRDPSACLLKKDHLDPVTPEFYGKKGH